MIYDSDIYIYPMNCMERLDERMAVAIRAGMALVGAVLSSSSFAIARRVGVLPIPTPTQSSPSCSSLSFSSVARAHSKRRPVHRSSTRKNNANRLSNENKNDNESNEIVRAKEILGAVDLQAEAEADAGKRLADDQEKKKSAFEEWLDEKLAARELSQTADGEGARNWVQVDKARRKFYEKRRRRMYGSDSEDERPQEDKYVELKPEIVEFPSFHAKQEELYFYDAFCFPWERDQHYRLIRKLEQKYYPHQGLENALIDPYEPSQACTTRAAEEATKSAKTKADGRKTTLTGNGKNVETKGKENVAPKRLPSESRDTPTAQIDLNPNDIRQGLSQKKVKEFLKSLKHAPTFDGPRDMPYLLSKSSELPAKWDGPSGTAVLIDKPKGWTSFTVCGKLRRMVKVEKVGHAGTLDPMATGLLIVCVGKATKQVQSFQDMIKVYSGVFRLGEATSTWDADSPVTGREPWEHIKDDDIQKAVTSFYGEIWQVPPMFSAIKVGGEKMYDKARKGETIDLPPRRVSIYDFHVERSLEDRQNLIFKVTCSKGTYVRSLCADFGRTLGSCAHLTALRREQIGDYSVVDAWKFSELEDAIIKQYI